MRMTLDFYVRVLGMPIVHGLRTPSRPPGGSHAHRNGAPPYANIPHYFLDMGGDSLLAFFEYPKGIGKVDRDAIGGCNMFHSPVGRHGIGRYWSD
jgi:catechol 2,3-dioxygenase-like lactoylglutathione lyase family enzyme